MVRPFHPGDQFELPMPGIPYYPSHPLMQQLNAACSSGDVHAFKELVSQWKQSSSPSPPPGPPNYPMGTLEPVIFHAIRSDQAEIVDYLLREGIIFNRLLLADAVSSEASSAVWQVFLDHGLDINAPLERNGMPPLAYVRTAILPSSHIQSSLC